MLFYRVLLETFLIDFSTIALNAHKNNNKAYITERTVMSIV